MALKKSERYTGQNEMRVENLSHVADWKSTLMGAMSKEGFRRIMIMTTDHRKTLPLVLGKAHQHFQSEYRNHVWRIERDGNLYWIFSSPKGTTIEWDRRGDPAKVVEFMEWVEEQFYEALRLGDPDFLVRMDEILR